MSNTVKRLKILSRKNLKMSPGKLAAQAVHAALGLYQLSPQLHWSCVVLEVSDKKFEEFKQLHPESYVVHDAGYTEVAPGSETCLAFYEEDPRAEERLKVVEILLDEGINTSEIPEITDWSNAVVGKFFRRK